MLGGHVQTGGSGMLARAFGLMADHVEACELITADGRVCRVLRPMEDLSKTSRSTCYVEGADRYSQLRRIGVKGLASELGNSADSWRILPGGFHTRRGKPLMHSTFSERRSPRPRTLPQVLR